MTLISVTRTILKPTSPDDGGGDSCKDGWGPGFMQGRTGTGFMQNSHGIRVAPEFRCRCLWPAGTSQPRGWASDTGARHHAEFGWFSACSDGLFRFGRFLRRSTASNAAGDEVGAGGPA